VSAEATLVAETLRVNTRYVEEVVIGWELCPWAARAWIDGQVTQRVFAGAEPAADDVAAFIDELHALPDAAIGLAIFPRFAGTAGAWEKFAENIRRMRGEFMVAAFHPDYRAPDGLLDAARLVPFIRRTPDPTLQLVRASLVDSLRGQVSSDVARANFTAVTGRGLAKLDALLADIRRDRDASCARG
jgi:hypothetical protein